MEEINNEFNHIWDSIINDLFNKTIDIQTIKLNKENGIWFSVGSMNDKLIIDKSINKKPSSKISNQRIINKNEFLNIYQYYILWKNKEIERNILRNKSKNTSYILGIINYYKEAVL